MRAERFYPVVVAALSVAIVASHVLGATVGMGVLWGTHFYGFFPPAALAVSLAATLAAALAIDLRMRRPPAIAPPGRDGAAARVGLPLALGALAALAFWGFRIRHTLLGDSGPLSHNLPLGERSHPRQPLSLALHHQVYEWARPLFEAPGRSPQEVAYDTVALDSVVAGALFVPVAIALARHLVAKPAQAGAAPGTADRTVTLAAAALLLTQGYMQLFFGYVENYTWFALAFALFLWAGLAYLGGQVPLVAAALALVAAIGLNLSGIVLLPALALLAAWGLARPATRAAAIRDSLATVVIVLGLQAGLAALGGFRATEGFRYMWNLVVRGEATDHTLATLVSVAHVRDFVSFHLLMGPFAGFFFLPAVFHRVTTRPRGDARLAFLVAAALPAFAASWLYGDSIQGLPRDWDLFAPFGLLYTAAALHCLASAPMSTVLTTRLLALAAVVSLFHTGSWVAINTSPERSLERYATLPLSRGRPEMTVGYWYLTHGEKERARRWFERSVAVYPGNNTSQYQLGLFAVDEGRYEEAARRFRIASRSRPDKTNYRFALVDALVLAGHPEEAAAELEQLLGVEPGRADFWGCYGIVLSGLGRSGEARAALARAAALAPAESRFPKLIGRLGEPDAYERAVREDWDALVVK